jgi:hypothetical protein
MRHMPLCRAINHAMDTNARLKFEMTSFVSKSFGRAKRRVVFPCLVKDKDQIALSSEEDGQARLHASEEERKLLAHILLAKIQLNKIHHYPDVHDTALDAFKHLNSLNITHDL